MNAPFCTILWAAPSKFGLAMVAVLGTTSSLGFLSEIWNCWVVMCYEGQDSFLCFVSFVVGSLKASPLTKPFFAPGGRRKERPGWTHV